MKVSSKYAGIIFFCILAYVYILSTNFSNIYVNTFVIIMILGITLVSKAEVTIIFFPAIIIYFGYSLLEFPNMFNMEKSQLLLYYAIAFAMKNFMELPKLLSGKKFRMRIMLMVTLVILMMFQSDVVSVIKLIVASIFMLYFVGAIVENGIFARNFVLAMLVSLLSTYLYYLIYVVIFTLPDTTLDLMAGRYCGTKDPNNFALFSNLCILFLDYTGCIKNKKIYNLTMLILSIGVLLTVSMSGIFTLAGIYFMKYIGVGYWSVYGNAKKTKSKLFKISAIIIAVIFICGLEILLNNDSVVLKVIYRIGEITKDISLGDYSSATSSRTHLWNVYLERWYMYSDKEKWLGSYDIYASMITRQLASHNFYIDFLMTYGIIGAIVFAIYMVYSFLTREEKMQKMLLLIQCVFLINLLFRSFDVEAISTFAFLLL